MFRYLTAAIDHLIHYTLAPAHLKVDNKDALARLQQIDRDIAAGRYQGADVKGTRTWAFRRIDPRSRLVAINRALDLTKLDPAPGRGDWLSFGPKTKTAPVGGVLAPEDDRVSVEAERERQALAAHASYAAEQQAIQTSIARNRARYAQYQDGNTAQAVLNAAGTNVESTRLPAQEILAAASPYIAATPDVV